MNVSWSNGTPSDSRLTDINVMSVLIRTGIQGPVIIHEAIDVVTTNNTTTVLKNINETVSNEWNISNRTERYAKTMKKKKKKKKKVLRLLQLLSIFSGDPCHLLWCELLCQI